jgi:ParB-like chromosome segregation protein Spo0J
VVTRDRTILDGHARLELARLQGRATLPCIEYELTESEALHWLLQRHRRSDGLSALTRILLALDLEPWFKEKARLNQRAGGRKKGSSKLTEAKKLDVRREIAAAAGVSVGNVSKVKQLTLTAHSELLQALRNGEISIHRAWGWSKTSPEKQREELRFYQSERGVKKTIRLLVSRHRPNILPALTDFENLVRRLSALEPSELGVVRVDLINAPGRAVFLTNELSRALGLQQELPFTCARDSR